MRRSAIAALSLVLSACTAAVPVAEPATPPASVAAPSPPAIPASGYQGRYTLVSVDGVALDNPFDNTRPTLLIDAQAIHFASQCIGHSWSWSETSGTIRTARYVRPESDGVVGMCARGFLEFEQATIDALGAVEASRITQNGALVVEGTGHQLLFDRLDGPDIALRGRWEVATLDGEAVPGSERIVLYGNDTQLWWEPACAGQRAEIDLDFANGGAGWSARQVDTAGAIVCQIGLPPRLGDVWDALEAGERAEWTDAGGIAVTGDGRSVVLAPHHD